MSLEKPRSRRRELMALVLALGIILLIGVAYMSFGNHRATTPNVVNDNQRAVETDKAAPSQ